MLLTGAGHSSVLEVLTVMVADASVRALEERLLSANARHVIQQDGPHSLAKPAETVSLEGVCKAQLSAHHDGFPEGRGGGRGEGKCFIF